MVHNVEIGIRKLRMDDRSRPRCDAAYRFSEQRILRKSHIITQLTIFTIKLQFFLYLLHILCIIRDLQPLYKSCIGKRHSKYKTVVTILVNIKMNLRHIYVNI